MRFAIMMFLLLVAVLGVAAPCPAGLPTWPQVQALVEKHLASQPKYKPGDLLAQSDVEPIFNELLERGYKPADNEELYDAFLPDNDYLVGVSRTTAGKKFLRKVKHLPGVYDRLERLSWLPTGRTLLSELIAHPQGAAQFESLSSGEGAKSVRKLLGDDPRGKNFLLPTGHVHTAEELLEKLRADLERQARKSGKTNQASKRK